MPATLLEQPLGLSCLFSKGTRVTAEVGETAEVNPTLSQELLEGLTNLVHPHGRIDAASTVWNYIFGLRKLVTWLSNAGFTGSAAQLSRARLAEFWMGCGHVTEQTTRGLLKAAHEHQVVVLSAETWGLVQGRAFNPQRRTLHTPLTPYTEGEWTRLRDACQDVIRPPFAAHRRALEAAERGQDPKTGWWTPENIRWLLREWGPIGVRGIAKYLGNHRWTISRWGGTPPGIVTA